MGQRKAKAERKMDVIRLRVTDEQKRVLTQAAHRAGLELSGWLRSLALREARKD